MTIVLGAGPVGLMAALALARRGQVTLVGERAATGTRIDAVPVGLLGLLIEFGIHPAQIDASSSHTAMLAAWELETPQAFRTPAKAHIDRQRLERELWRRIEETSAITVTRRRAIPNLAGRVCIDATGRAASSATRILRPPTPWVARTLTVPGKFGEAQQALRIGAFPGGYVYRLASPRVLTLGLVGPRRSLPPIDTEPGLTLSPLGLTWLLAGLEPNAPWQTARGGEASVQWSIGESKIARIGDANLACDALSSQGMALGISDALAFARDEAVKDRLPQHLENLHAILSRCRFARMSAWREYADFVLQAMDAGQQSAIGSLSLRET